jgi:hypothetical protein
MSASEAQAATVLTSENAAEFYAQRMGLAAQDEPTEAAEADPVESDEGQNESEADAEPEQKEAAADEPEKKSKPKIEKRIGEVVKQREQAKAEAAKERAGRESAEARLREYEQKAAPEKAADPDAEPKPEQFTDAFEYARALAEFSAEKALKDRDRQEAEKKAATERQQTIKQWTDRITAVKADLPDFEDVVASSDVAVSDQVRDAILESDVGPQVLYHLAENPEFAQKLSEMSTITALREIGKLEARFEKKEPAKAAATKQRAPAPIRPIKGNGSAMDVPINSDGVFHGSYQAWKQARLAGKIR